MGNCGSSSKKDRDYAPHRHNPYMGKTRDIAVGERCWQCQDLLTKTKVAFEGKGFCDRCYEQVTGDMGERAGGYRPHRPEGRRRREKHRPHAMEQQQHHHHYDHYNQHIHTPNNYESPGVVAYQQQGGYRRDYNNGYNDHSQERMDGYYDYSTTTQNDSGYDQ